MKRILGSKLPDDDQRLVLFWINRNAGLPSEIAKGVKKNDRMSDKQRAVLIDRKFQLEYPDRYRFHRTDSSVHEVGDYDMETMMELGDMYPEASPWGED